jgi:diguanylate cyclase (GGDEF)-like protein/PAS domain S-box-containing protein
MMFEYSVMLIKFFDRITTRLIINVIFVATLIASMSSYIFFERTYQAELERNSTTLQQLVQAVSNTASIATYLEDMVLGKEVVEGITANHLVKAVELRSHYKMIANSGDMSQASDRNLIHFSLNSPFDETEYVGELIVNVNYALIEAYAKNTALEHVVLISIHSLVLLLVIMTLLKYQLVDVIRVVAQSLHNITPGSDQRIACPAEHTSDEIGLLTGDINQLLKSVEMTLNSERALRTEVEEFERRFRGIFEQTSGGIALIDNEGYLKVHNPSFEKILGTSRMARLSNDHQESLFSVMGTEALALQKSVNQALLGTEPISIDLKVSDNDDVRWLHCMFTKMIDDATDTPMLEIIIQDVSERRNREHTFKIQAELDPLTGLYNRRAGKEKIQYKLDAAEHSGIEYALLMIDLDNFKPINDQYGHKAGDLVLTTLAKRFTQHVRADDIVIRWGGDEILMFIKQENHDLDIPNITQKLMGIIQEPITLEGEQTIMVGASIGHSIFPLNGFDLDLLIQRADEVMYEVKSQIKADNQSSTNSNELNA